MQHSTPPYLLLMLRFNCVKKYPTLPYQQEAIENKISKLIMALHTRDNTINTEAVHTVRLLLRFELYCFNPTVLRLLHWSHHQTTNQHLILMRVYDHLNKKLVFTFRRKLKFA